MNRYKLKAILEFITGQASLLTGAEDASVDPGELLACLGLDKLLPLEEQRVIRRELFDMAEAETFMDQVRLGAGP